jgi:hypothetical protein
MPETCSGTTALSRQTAVWRGEFDQNPDIFPLMILNVPRAMRSTGGTWTTPERSVSSLGDCRGRASRIDEELTKFDVDVLVASEHKEFDVFDDLQHGASSIERLGGHSRSIAVMDAVVTPLEDRPESVLELIICFDSCLMLFGIAHGKVFQPQNAEESDLRI